DLTGKTGRARNKTDVRQKVYQSEIEADAEPGKIITLTVDERIQFVAERELAAAVREHNAKTGSLVVMDPSTGHILALANFPDYDPNVAPKPGEDPQNRRNLSVIAPFEPGSVFKVITVATALDTTRLTPANTFHCGNGSMTLFRRVIHDAKPHGVLSVADILAKSSNIGAIKIAMNVGEEKLYDYIRRFGFGQVTGLPLPGESGGVVRKLSRWIPSSIGSVAMGHELSATSVQLAQACSVVANGGFRVTPTLVMSKERPGGDVERAAPAERVQILRPENAMKMRMMMEGVVLHGTGKAARLDGYSSAGKTGSAQIFDYASRSYTHRYNGSFMGFAPVTNPRIVVVVTLNGTTKFGGVVAAPVFHKVATAALRYLDVPRDLPESINEPGSDVSIDPDLAIADLSQPPEIDEEETGTVLLAQAKATVPPRVFGPEPPPVQLPVALANARKTPDFTGKTKRAVLEQSSALGFRVEIAGAGIARSQQPPPGAPLPRGERVRVTFAP
ncbi:MAG TPA: penicillin-binding protein, partial [Bryobacteraceae bacterium]|nr:penicillin-binding protein [Bryobacteraceae bacterium]